MEVFPHRIFKSEELLAAEVQRAYIEKQDLYENLQTDANSFYDYSLVSADTFDNILFIQIQYDNLSWKPAVDDNGLYTYVACHVPEAKWNSRDEAYSLRMFPHSYYRFYPVLVDYNIKSMGRTGIRETILEEEDLD